jgi:phosphoribosylcarboxyaminoimidazole (NCAIR) mutase
MTFAEPLAFAFAGLYGVLVLLYLSERWRRRVTVPSLILWAAIREDIMRARRFRPDVLFILQFLLLTCLILGLAGPHRRAAGGGRTGIRHIFVLDTSASMQAREGSSSRFDQVRAQALNLLHDLRVDDEVMLVTAGRSPEVVLNSTRDHAAVAAALEHAVATDAGGDLALAVGFADTARQPSDVPTEVDVFTDIPRGQLPPQLRDQVTVFQVGESDDNLGIEALQVFQGRFQDYRKARVHVLVRNFAHREGHGFLSVLLEDRVVHRIGFTIPSRESKGFLVEGFPGPGRVVARLDVTDALAADNTAYGWIRPVQPVHVLLVSPPSTLVDDLRQLAAATPALQLEVVDPQAYAAAAVQSTDLMIFHRFAPDALPPTNALYVYPPKENHLFPVAAEATNIEVLDWNVRHAALQSLRPLAALPLQRAHIIAAPEWTQVLLWSRTIERQLPLAFAGEHDGHRVACLTFDLEAEHLLGSDNVNLFLFFMNLLGWLTPQTGDPFVVNTGEVQSFSDLPAGTLQVRDPRGGAYTLPAVQPTLELQFAGEYQVSSDGTRRTVLANFFDAAESDIGRTSKEPPIFHTITAQHGPQIAAHERPPGDSTRWFYGVAVVLCLIEWAVAQSRSA